MWIWPWSSDPPTTPRRNGYSPAGAIACFSAGGRSRSSDPSDDLLRQVVQKAVAGAVPDLERGKEDEHLLERLDREAAVLVVEGVRDEWAVLRLEVRGAIPFRQAGCGVLGFKLR
jgi:hypothetical protein